MKLKPLRRSISADDIEIDEEGRIVRFPFSSEYPVDRWFGKEILSHSPGACDLSRLNSGAQLLWNHDMDKVLGVVEGAEIKSDEKRGYCTDRFSKSAFADEKFQEVKDKIIRNVSFGYRIDEMTCLNPGAEGEEPIYLATKWTPYEISLVSIPADPTVGIGRASDIEAEYEVRVISTVPKTKESKSMTEEERKALEAKVRAETEAKVRAETEAKIRTESQESERSRIATITVLGERFGDMDLARQLIDGNKSIEEARTAFVGKAQKEQKPVVQDVAMIDFSESEKIRYSLVNAIRAAITGNWKDAGFEREVSLEIAKRTGKETTGFFMPLNIKMDGKRAAYNTGTANQGGNLVATNLLADSFIELLRNKMLMMNMGARTLSGLVGNIAIPKQLTGAQAYWVAEGVDVTESEGTFGQVTMTPKTVGARSQMTRQMMIQGTPDIEMLVRSDLAAVLALAIDAAAISGLGSSGQPKGILNQSGIGSVAMGTNGAAFSNIDPLIDLETLVATANADFGQMGYITNAAQVGKLKKLKATTNEYLWNGYEAAVAGAVPGEINGYRVGRTNQVPSNLTKGTSSGVCSAMIFGNFNDLIIGQWGPGVEILANPYGAGFNSGGVDIRALASVDVAVRNAASFAAITDLL